MPSFGTGLVSFGSLSGSLALSQVPSNLFSADAAGRAPFADGIWLDAKIGAAAALALSKIATGALPAAITVNNGNWSGAALAQANIATGALPAGITVNNGNWSGTALALSNLAATVKTTGYASAVRTTTSTTAVHAGDAIAFTPTSKTIMLVLCQIFRYENTAAGNGERYQIRYGTGAAPLSGDAVTGTILFAGAGTGEILRTEEAVAGYDSTLATWGYATGLSLNTAYWIDLTFSASAGTETLDARNYLVIEVL